ncbi:MAG: hypothetical protein NTX45_28175 [Proteobacteria bacterium]|nr:hypothetical protein [Pseudomonadota bacterium]
MKNAKASRFVFGKACKTEHQAGFPTKQACFEEKQACFVAK